jgi:hypothetical protein
MILELLAAVVAGLVGGLVGGIFAAGFRRPRPPGLTAKARNLDAQLAEALDYETSLEGLQLEIFIHIYDALERIASGGRQP